MLQRKFWPTEEQKAARKAKANLEALQRRNWTQEQRLRILEKKVKGNQR